MPSRESSLRNLERAISCWRSPRRWRSIAESRVIKRFVWQWFTNRSASEWSGRAVARFLSVSHTHVQKLTRQFESDPNRMREEERRYGLVGVRELIRSREVSSKEREQGLLRLRSVRRTEAEAIDMREVPDWIVRTQVLSPSISCDPLSALRYSTPKNQIRATPHSRRVGCRWRRYP